MAAADALARLAARSSWMYGGGLAGILAIRSVAPPSTGRSLAVSLLLGAMVLTYAADLWVSADRPRVRIAVLVPGIAGVVVGSWLALSGTFWGLLFVGGGLLFLNRGLGGGERT